MRHLTTGLVVLLFLVSCNRITPFEKGIRAISEQEVKEQVNYLASDFLEGRQAGSKGAQMAAEYIIRYLDSLGIKPLDGNYRHTFECEPFNYVRYSAGIHDDSLAASYHIGNSLCNVMAVIEGKNPDETILAGAHYDHIGSYPGLVEGDCVFNGADDNASGTVALMQIAKAFAASGWQPEKTLILAFWDGEERNIKGSTYFAEHDSTFGNIKHCLNFDMVGRGTADSIACICSKYWQESYIQWINEAINVYGLNLDITTESEYDLTGISDHRMFALAGIPCLWFFSGEHEDVHTPFDEASKLNTRKITDTAKAAYYVLWHLCNE